MDKPSIKEAFNAAATQAATDFPKALRHLVVTTADDVIFVTPKTVAKGFTEKDFETVRASFVEKWDNSKSIAASYASYNCKDTGNWWSFSFNVLAIGINAEASDCLNAKLWWSFDHEIGHLVVQNGTKAKSLAERECLAETYAALRHVQRHGVESGYIKAFNLARANTIIERNDNSVYYYHPLALDKVEALKTQTDLSMLSPQETVELTSQIVTECFWSGDDVRSKIQSAANDLNEGDVSETRLVDLFSKANDVVVARFYQDVLAHRYPDTKPSTNSVPKRIMKDGF